MKKDNKRILLLVREKDSLMEKVIKYNFKDLDLKVIPENYTPFNREDLAININKKYDSIIMYGYYSQFSELLPLISKKVERKWIIDYSISSLSFSYIFQNLAMLFEFQDRGMIDVLATTDYSLYVTFKEKMKYIVFDYKEKDKTPKENRVGILNIDKDDISNFYNQISGVAISKIRKARVLNANDETYDFSKKFNVEIEIEKDIEKLIYGNIINLDIKFSDVSPINFIMSMDAGIPCILGNTSLLHGSELENILVVKSDDDVEETKEKINYALDNTNRILDIYKKWREDYTKLSNKTINDFMK